MGKDDDTTTAASPKAATSALPAAVLKDVTTVPASVSDTVGAAGVTSVPQSIDAPALTENGKPKVLYIGAEYCPF